MTAFYNEIDPYAAQWLRNLIAAGHITPGVVDERSIEDIKPEELHGYTQCHFFAGVGVWSLALRHAGWPDDRPIWTGSCPCQPFSAAGQGAGFADERHLWPAFYHLIAECRPPIILGEQVASSNVNPWIDLVHADLEAVDYAVGGVPFPAASIGAPHIRDRLYWVAYAHGGAGGQRGADLRGWADGSDAQPRARLGGSCVLGGLADTDGGNTSAKRQQRCGEQRQQPQDGGCSGLALGGLGDAGCKGLDQCECERGILGRASGAVKGEAAVGAGIYVGGLADATHERQGREPGELGSSQSDGVREIPGEGAGVAELGHYGADVRPGPTNGYWATADWLGCRDGKWRPVEPGTFPLAHGAPARVGRLRAYGNAINAEAARVFIQAVMESL